MKRGVKMQAVLEITLHFPGFEEKHKVRKYLYDSLVKKQLGCANSVVENGNQIYISLEKTALEDEDVAWIMFFINQSKDSWIESDWIEQETVDEMSNEEESDPYDANKDGDEWPEHGSWSKNG